MSSINFLPPWVETNLQPAFYDKESGTCLQQTARMYNKVNELVRSVNTQNETIADYIQQFIDLREYVEDYFDNLDVQVEINNKIDSMVSDGTFQTILDGYVQPQLESLNAKINNEAVIRENADNQLQNLITTVGNGAPLTATSTVGMTDTTKVYVNTTNGKWYYYDGDSWEIGGDYQSAVIGENTIEPYMTKFLITENILPYTDWIEGKVYNNGAEANYASGCLNRATVDVTGGDTLFVVNSSNLPMTDVTVVEYEADDTFIKQTRLGYTLNASVVLDGDTSYVKFSSTTNKFTTLPVNSLMIVPLSSIKKLMSYSTVFEYAPTSRQTVKANEIFVENEYGHRIIPRIYKSNLQNTVTNLNFINTYSVEYTSIVTGSGNTSNVLFGVYVYADNVTTDDYIYADFSKSPIKPDYVSFFIGTSSQGQLTNLGDGVFRVKLTQTMIDALPKGNCYVFGTFMNQTVGQDVTYHIDTYINENYTDITALLNKQSDEQPINFIYLGDSITHLSGDRSWVGYFTQIVNGNTIANVAVDGAQLRDNAATVYDGDPKNSNPTNNVLGNQVQKIINQAYDAPDVIMIAIGTNGGINLSGTELYDAYFNTTGVKPLTDVDRKTDAGAYRWCTQKLHEAYPNAKIIWCTPILTAYNTVKTPEVVTGWGDNLKKFCSYGSTYCFDTEKCGINATNASEYLYDGLHPDVGGARLMGEYNAGEFMKIAKVIRKR